MSDSKNGNGRDGAAEAAEGQQGAEPTLETQIAQAEAEAADLKDRLLRALAEAENVRRRAERERDDARK